LLFASLLDIIISNFGILTIPPAEN